MVFRVSTAPLAGWNNVVMRGRRNSSCILRQVIVEVETSVPGSESTAANNKIRTSHQNLQIESNQLQDTDLGGLSPPCPLLPLALNVGHFSK